jgi:hypothetical protein
MAMCLGRHFVAPRRSVGVDLSRAIRRPGVERRLLGLRGFLDLAEHFGRGRLIEPGLADQPQDADGLKQPECAQGVRICRVLRRLKRDLNVTLRAKVVKLVWLNRLDDPDQVRRVSQIAVVQDEPSTCDVRILIQMIDAVGIELRCPSLDAVDLVPFPEEKLG